VELNKNLWRAAEEFNLTRRDFQPEDYATGIWDGRDVFVSVRKKFSF
jgi:prenylcysteine oxidase/farnesylcysteine lyase